MELRTVLLILLAVAVAGAAVFYSYFYKNPTRGTLTFGLAALRFITLFCALLLLINPKYIKKEFFLEKAQLLLLVDDSASMQQAATAPYIAEQLTQLRHTEALTQHFNVHAYAFGTTLYPADTLQFDKKQTDIANALSTVDEHYGSRPTAVVLFTDGNTTLGRDYEYLRMSASLAVYPVVVGDTAVYEDISVVRVTTNPYAFLKNKFPLEATITYQGNRPVSKAVTVFLNGTPIHQQRIALNATKNSTTIRTLIEAQTIGFKTLKVEAAPLANEKNTGNNHKETALEVIDEKTQMAIISDLPHPDIGALKKAIEANAQRTVRLLKPTATTQELKDIDVFVLYQPNRSFERIYKHITQSGASRFTLTGPKTDWDFLNAVQQSFYKENLKQPEAVRPVLNTAFHLFGLGDFAVDDFPPLESDLGAIILKEEAQTLLFQQIHGTDIKAPLFAVFTKDTPREAVLLGEHSWRWRAQTYRNTQSFRAFDDLIGKLVMYLAGNHSRRRLTVDFDRILNPTGIAKISASYFDKSYRLNLNADLNITIRGKDNDFLHELPMVVKDSSYELDLSNLEAGEYRFTVTVQGENITQSGAFTMLDYNLEAQQQTANYTQLKRLADRTNGDIYFPRAITELMDDLSTANRYRPIQQSRKNSVSLVDFQGLLGLIVLALALEWCIRKYNGFP